jgi:hypothetical protein
MPNHLRDYARHHIALVVVVLVCVWISLSLILRMWMKYPREAFLKKLGWSIVLCVPFLGWLFYGGFFIPLSDHNTPLPMSQDSDMGPGST